MPWQTTEKCSAGVALSSREVIRVAMASEWRKRRSLWRRGREALTSGLKCLRAALRRFLARRGATDTPGVAKVRND